MSDLNPRYRDMEDLIEKNSIYIYIYIISRIANRIFFYFYYYFCFVFTFYLFMRQIIGALFPAIISFVRDAIYIIISKRLI